ncbi:MAG: haloacid dehalogenase-like hydrolase [Lachnospiraceae bacterium]|nr:haloacid dehalogenase-like hydrolase [Lachnospiraceae bacterium]
MKKMFKKLGVGLLAFLMVINVSFFDTTQIKADETVETPIVIASNEAVDPILAAKPRISVSANGDKVTLTIKKTEGAEGYLIYAREKGTKEYECIGQLDKDGSKKRKFSLSGLPNGTYYIKVKAYAGTIASEFSKAKKVVINVSKPDVHSELLSLWEADAPAKQAIVSYMEAITDENSKDYIPVEDRIAVFDMDGTVYCETDPNYFDHLLLAHRVLEDKDYVDKASEFEKKVANDVLYMNETGKEPENMSVNHGTAVASSFKGFTPDEFYDYIAEFKKTPMNSYTNMTLGEAFYEPMLEIIDFLKANDFTVYIVSGTDRFIVRGLLKDSKLDLPMRQLIGSDVTLVSDNQGDTDGLNYVYTDKDEVVFGGEFIVKNLKMNKVTVIVQEIGTQPVLSFGNSTGDSSMAEYVTTNNKYKSLAFMLCCDDTERENGNIEKANKMYSLCEQFDWVPVSMKNDWKTIYGEGVEKINE